MSLANAVLAASAISFAAVASGCDKPNTTVIVDNDYPPSSTQALVVYRVHWQAVNFAQPIAPGASSEPEPTVPASGNTAYVLLAPGWDPTSSASPTSFVVMESSSGFGVHLGDTLHIPVDDATFYGNCAANSFLSPSEADFITRQVFPSELAGLAYDPTTCTTTTIGDGASGDAP
ncbi:MAG TPA: hypothetical protein VLM85_03080 [Polyangiaceae bacterium]|nr:hypothetical protein [Polyangiaceae bacterium]